MLNNPFYYGEFKYGGEWYRGAHQPLISKELFDKARKALVRPPQGKWGGKDFAFTRYITCMGCGSKLIGEEKIKRLKDGGENRHIYYHCSRHIGADCDEPYLKPEVLLDELTRILKPDMIKHTPEIQDEFSRAVSAAREMGSKASEAKIITNYIRATIKTGTTAQRRMIMDKLSIKLEYKLGRIYAMIP